MEPQAALGAVASLPVTRLASSLTGVSAAAQHTVGNAQADLAANPPSMERPSGVPADKDASLPPAPLPPLPVAAERTRAADCRRPRCPAPDTGRAAASRRHRSRSACRTRRPAATPRSAPRTRRASRARSRSYPPPTRRSTSPQGRYRNWNSAAARIRNRSPTRPPTVEDTTAGAQQDGLADARADMGENDVLPQVPKETLTADVERRRRFPDGFRRGNHGCCADCTGASGDGNDVNWCWRGGCWRCWYQRSSQRERGRRWGGWRSRSECRRRRSTPSPRSRAPTRSTPRRRPSVRRWVPPATTTKTR